MLHRFHRNSLGLVALCSALSHLRCSLALRARAAYGGLFNPARCPPFFVIPPKELQMSIKRAFSSCRCSKRVSNGVPSVILAKALTSFGKHLPP